MVILAQNIALQLRQTYPKSFAYLKSGRFAPSRWSRPPAELAQRATRALHPPKYSARASFGNALFDKQLPPDWAGNRPILCITIFSL
jgi:hypothetical protein